MNDVTGVSSLRKPCWCWFHTHAEPEGNIIDSLLGLFGAPGSYPWGLVWGACLRGKSPAAGLDLHTSPWCWRPSEGCRELPDLPRLCFLNPGRISIMWDCHLGLQAYPCGCYSLWAGDSNNKGNSVCEKPPRLGFFSASLAFGQTFVIASSHVSQELRGGKSDGRSVSGPSGVALPLTLGGSSQHPETGALGLVGTFLPGPLSHLKDYQAREW